MRRSLIIVGFLLALGACKNNDPNSNIPSVSSVKFPPPVVKPDEETLKNADPGAKDPKGDVKEAKLAPNTDVIDADDNNTSKATITDTTKKVTKDGTLNFETDDLLATRKQILAALNKYGGYVDEDNQSMNSDSNREEYELKIRVPARYFDLLLDTVSATASKIDSKSITITDVTTSFIDMSTRLANKKALEKRYLELLSKATKIADLSDLEEKLDDIRSDIESTQGQLNYLNRQIVYSSLDITFYTKHSEQHYSSGSGFGHSIKKALAHGWHRLQNLFFGLIGLWPYLLLLGVAYWLVKIWLKRRKTRGDGSDQ